MTIEYILLKDGTGVLLDRAPKILDKEDDDVKFLFVMESADTVIFKCENGDAFYRNIENGECVIKLRKLIGGASVTVVHEGEDKIARWQCDSLFVERKNDVIVVYPNDLKTPEAVAQLRVDNNNLRIDLKKQQEEINSIKKRIEKLMEGYDLV